MSTIEKNASKNLEAEVAEFKINAREALRKELISPRLNRIQGLEDELGSLAKSKENTDLEIKVENYEISKLDTDHPYFDKRKADKEETVKYLTERLESNTKAVEEVNKKITEQKEAIAKIESGETKVSKDALNALVARMVEQSALNSVATS